MYCVFLMCVIIEKICSMVKVENVTGNPQRSVIT